MPYEGRLYDFEPHQIRVLNQKARFRVLIWHRKSRKTTFFLKNAIRKSFLKKGVRWIIEPYQNQARRTIWEDPSMLDAWLPASCQKNNTEMKITFPNGSLLYLIGADNPENLRGSGLEDVWFDEFDDIPMTVWTTIIRPMLILTHGTATFGGTTKGQGNLFNLLNQANRGIDSDWWADDVLSGETSGLIPPEELKAIQDEVKNGTMPQLAYDQEICCKFISGGANVFRRIKENTWHGQLTVEPNRKYAIGVDLAKLSDFTVITPIDLHSWYVGIPDRFQQLDYPMIEARIEANWRKYNKGILRIEKNSIGEAVIDHLINDKNITNIDAFQTTEATKEAALKNLSILLETDQIKIPDYEPLLKELQTARWERSEKSKKIKMEWPDGYHEDCVMSLAFAVWDLPRLPLEKPINPLFAEAQRIRAREQSNVKTILRI